MASPRSLHDPMVVPLNVSKDEAVPVKMVELNTAYKIGVDTAIIVGKGEYDYYEGHTTVTPLAHSQTVLETAGKVVLDNIKVLKIPYYETSNLSDGYTAYIGGEV